MSKQKKEFQKVVESASLIGVSLISSRFEIYVPPEFVQPQKTSLEFKKNIQPFINQFPGKNSGSLNSHIHFTVAGKSKSDIKEFNIKKNKQLFFISVSYFVGYRLENMKGLDHKMLKFFGTENSFFNAYPFLREFIHHTSLRLNIPPVTIPLLKPAERILEEKDSDAAPAVRSKKAKAKSRSRKRG